MRYAVNELMMDGKNTLRYHSPAATTVRRTLFLSLRLLRYDAAALC